MRGIAFKLWSGMMILVLAVLILLWFFQIVFLESFYLKMRVSDIKKEGKSIIKLLAEGDKSGFESKANAFTVSNNLSVELIDINGNILYVSGTTSPSGQIPMLKNNTRVEAYSKIINGNEVSISMSHPRFGNKFMLIGIPYKVYEKVSGAFFINIPLAPVEDTAAILKKQLIYISLILLIVAVIISFFISKTFTKPILEIKKVSEKIASGDFSDRIENKSKDEIGSLAQSINYMGQELSKIDQLRKDLIANVSHELRTPLSLIRGYAETIKDISGDIKEKREKHLEIIIEESERLSKIVDDILNLSQLQAGYLSLNQECFSINKTIQDVIKRYDILAEKSGIQMFVICVSDIMVLADKSKIEQVLYNLINNAFNHTKQGGKIIIKVLDSEKTVKVEVSDTGTGIPKEELQYIWNKYYKVEKTNERKILGTGLGLAIVKNILDAHKVPYDVESIVNQGTTLWFELKKK